mmetsp:Transcript_36128/g.64631  ORF Transcript_36128/g.64631 Transcript_36128/m.64631 type:complete len:221 (+) Transcript_36128:3166-3828(+)
MHVIKNAVVFELDQSRDTITTTPGRLGGTLRTPGTAWGSLRLGILRLVLLESVACSKQAGLLQDQMRPSPDVNPTQDLGHDATAVRGHALCTLVLHLQLCKVVGIFDCCLDLEIQFGFLQLKLRLLRIPESLFVLTAQFCFDVTPLSSTCHVFRVDPFTILINGILFELEALEIQLFSRETEAVSFDVGFRVAPLWLRNFKPCDGRFHQCGYHCVPVHCL